MLFASLILSIAFVGCMCILIKAGDSEKSPSPVIEYRQPDIHIHNNNNSHGGYSTSHGSSSDSTSHGGSSTSDSVSDSNSTSRGGSSHSDSISDSCSNNDNTNTTTDNVSEEIIQRELEQLREDIKRKQQLYMETLAQLDEFERKYNK